MSLFGRQFANRVEKHTAEARAKFRTGPNHLDRDLPDKQVWVSVITEQVGKLARSANKLSIAFDSDVRADWDADGRHCLLTIASLARRMAERWDELPDSHVYRPDREEIA